MAQRSQSPVLAHIREGFSLSSVRTVLRGSRTVVWGFLSGGVIHRPQGAAHRPQGTAPRPQGAAHRPQRTAHRLLFAAPALEKKGGGAFFDREAAGQNLEVKQMPGEKLRRESAL